MTLDDAWFAAELAICERASEGPWSLLDAPGVSFAWLSVAKTPTNPAMKWNYEDAIFIASARTGYPAALKALQETRGAMLRLETIAKAHQGLCEKEVCHGDVIVDAIRSEYAALAKLAEDAT